MRDVIFRAKRTDNGEWVDGSLIDSGNHEQVMIYPHYDGASTMGVRQLVYYSSVPVDHDTVCAWTGLTDKNGKRIFDGDIVANPNYPDEQCPVIYKPGYFAIRGLWDAALCDHNKQVEVVGNIYDNPDLIER